MLATVLLTSILTADTVADRAQNLDEVVIVSAAGRGKKRSAKGQVASIDEHLQQLSGVNLIRRGSYAWEPTVNNMQTERLSTTIDGMKIFYACTDKMDPVTSYVESGNLQSISLSSGLDGNPQATGNIGGSLDLRLRKAGFDNGQLTIENGQSPLHLNATAGHEWNGHVQVYGADAAHSSHRLYVNGGVFYRHADNYTVGGGRELPFSQFRKVNVFGNVGARLAEHDIVEATVIFDRATDVGYPALNMDVARAEGFITSVAYKHLFDEASLLQTWETKLYYNHIVHEMDDTHRPDVEIHMDMPGRSQTAGLYSLLTAAGSRHSCQLNYDLYYNRLLADMTMYPGGAAPMYMVTWPDVGTLCTGLALADDITLTDCQHLRLSAKLAWQAQRLNSDEGYHALRVFFPTMNDSYRQTTARLAANYRLAVGRWELGVGAGWGSRAPTVTEAYGYYLNNTFDRYDYMGNPTLSNESAVELNAALQFSASQSLRFKAQGNAFFFHNYIIGQFETRLSPMTVGAEGVKVYGNLPHATITNLSFTADWQPLKWFSWQAGAAYAAGRDADGDPLPLIAPLAWHNTLNFLLQPFTLHLTIKGNARQRDYGAKYGESETAGWTVCNASAEWAATDRLTVRAGVENIFDKHYSSYADWNGIPQKGRNIYLNLTFEW